VGFDFLQSKEVEMGGICIYYAGKKRCCKASGARCINVRLLGDEDVLVDVLVL